MLFTTKFIWFSLFPWTNVNHKHRKMRRPLKRPTQYSGSQRLPDESDFRKIFQTATLLIRSWEQLLKSRIRINHCENHVFLTQASSFRKWVLSRKSKTCRLLSSTKSAFWGDFNLLDRQSKICQCSLERVSPISALYQKSLWSKVRFIFKVK